jgi:dipeptidase E
MKNIIASTSTVHGGDYLEYLLPELAIILTLQPVFLFLTQDQWVSHEEYTKAAWLSPK